MLKTTYSPELFDRLMHGKHQEIDIQPAATPGTAEIVITSVELSRLDDGGLSASLHSNGVLVARFDPVQIAPGGKLVVDIAKCPYRHVISLS
jgi:hypothetical protein